MNFAPRGLEPHPGVMLCPSEVDDEVPVALDSRVGAGEGAAERPLASDETTLA